MLTPIRQGHSIVVAGAWNSRIFTPTWVAENIATGKEVGIAVAPTQPLLSMRLQFDGVFLHANPDRIILSPVQLDDDTLQRMEDIANKILKKLPHTPVTAIGVNFQYLESEPSGILLSAFRIADTDPLSDGGAKVKSTMVRRQMVIDNYFLNLNLELKPDGQATIEFNFHRDVETAEQALEHLDVGVFNFRKVAIDLLTNVYQLEGAEAHV